MSFTDEDLKRLKELRKQGYHPYTAFELNEVVTLVDALIARLEAAEWALKIYEKGGKPAKLVIATWRKASGK